MRIGEYSRLVRTNRNFRLLWLAQIISEMGDWLYSVAIYSLILEVTGSAQAVAFAFMLQVLPQTIDGARRRRLERPVEPSQGDDLRRLRAGGRLRFSCCLRSRGRLRGSCTFFFSSRRSSGHCSSRDVTL